MTTTGNAQDFGFDVWMRTFRDAMTAFQHAAPAASAGMPGMAAWPGQGWMPGNVNPAGFAGMGAWPGQMPGQMPGMSASGVAGPFAAMFEQLSALAQGQWQQFARQAAGDASASGAGDAMSQWRRMLEGMAPAMTAAFDPAAMRGLDQAALRDALSTPPIGPLREHVQRWQQAMLAQMDYQDAAQAFSAQLGEIMKLAMSYFERRLAARAEPGQTPLSMRGLFDEWIEAGEQAWAERAGSDAFASALGRYTNAQLRVRAAMADEVNRVAESLGLPTRGEVQSDHRRIAMLEREVRRVRAELEALQRTPDPAQPASAQATVKPRVVPIRPDVAVAVDNPAPSKPAQAATAKAKPASAKSNAKKSGAGKPRRAKAVRKSKTEKAESRPARRSKPKPAKSERPATSANVLPIVAAPRAIGAAADNTRGITPRRRASK